jgi:hypothetical protein
MTQAPRPPGTTHTGPEPVLTSWTHDRSSCRRATTRGFATVITDAVEMSAARTRRNTAKCALSPGLRAGDPATHWRAPRALAAARSLAADPAALAKPITPLAPASARPTKTTRRLPTMAPHTTRFVTSPSLRLHVRTVKQLAQGDGVSHSERQAAPADLLS